jgi:integrase
LRQRAPGSWELRVYAGVDARTGRVRYRTRTVRGSKGDAARALKELVVVVQSGPAFGAEAPFSTLLETWIAAKVPVWSAGTLMETRSIVRIHLLPRLGRVPVGAITTEQIDTLLAGVGRTRSAGTVNRVRGVVLAVLARAVRWDWIWSNPASHAARVETGPKSHVVPPPERVMVVLEWLRLNDPVFMLFVRLASTTGARRGELLGLRWSDIDFENARVRLVRGLVDAAAGPVLQERKTKNANCVDLDADTLTIFRAHHENAVERAVDTGLVVGSCPLFAQRHDASKPWKPNWVTKRFAVALDTAGVEHFRLHDLRHFVATQMLAAGIGLPVVAARLGHARVSTTLNVYAASMPAWDRAAAETLSALLRAS